MDTFISILDQGFLHQQPQVLAGKLVNKTPTSQISHNLALGTRTGSQQGGQQSQAQLQNTLENSINLENNSKKPQQMNINELSPFTAFKQTPDEFRIKVAESPKSSLQIDLGTVNDIRPVQGEIRPVLSETTNQDVRTFFQPGIKITSGPRKNPDNLAPSDNGVTTVIDVDIEPLDSNNEQFVTGVSSIVPEISDNDVEIPVIIEGTLGVRDAVTSPIKDDRNTAQFLFEDHPASKTRFQQLQVLQDPSIVPSSSDIFEDDQRDIIDLTDPSSIIPKIPGNDHSFIFATFGSGNSATSFGLNLDNIQNNPSNFQTDFSNILFTTPAPATTSASTLTRRRTTTSNPFRFNSVTRRVTAPTITKTSTTARTTTTRATTTRATTTRARTARTTTTTRTTTARVVTRSTTRFTSRPVVFTQKPVTFLESDRTVVETRPRLQSERLKLQSTRPTGVPGFEIFKLSATPTPLSLPDRPTGGQFNIVRGTQPPRPRGPPPPASPTPVPFNTPRGPSPTPFTFETPRGPSPTPSSRPRIPQQQFHIFSTPPPPQNIVTSQVTGKPLFVFSTPSPASVTPSSPSIVHISSTSQRPSPHVTAFSLNLTPTTPSAPVRHQSSHNQNQFNSFVHVTQKPFRGVNEISIPINITEVRDRNNAQHNTIVNSIHESQLDRKPKNQFSAGNGVVGVANTNPGSVFNNSPFVFLRQQLQEVKQNIVLPTGVVNPFQHSRIPQPQTGFLQPKPFTPIVFNNPNTVPGQPTNINSPQTFFSIGPTRPVVKPISNTSRRPLPQGTFVFRDPTLPILSPVSPTPIPLSPVVSTTVVAPAPASVKPVVFSEPSIKPLPGVLLEDDRNSGADQHISLIIEETSKETEEQDKRVSTNNGSVNKDISNSPLFDPRKRRTTKKPSLVPTHGNSVSIKIKDDMFKERKPVLTGHDELDTATEDLQERIRKLKESLKKTKESLTSQRQTFFSVTPSSFSRSSSPSPTSIRPSVGRPVRKRVKARKRIPSRLRHRNKLNENKINEINIPINIEETPRSSNRLKGRGRGRNTIKIKPEIKESIMIEEVLTEKPDKNEILERELEDTYGKEVVQGLLNVLVKAVSHPDKDRILHQLKGQLSAMNVDDVKKLQFGVETRPYSERETTIPTTSTEPPTTTTTPTTAKFIATQTVKVQEKKSEFESAIEQQLKRVANLAGRFKNNKPIFVNSDKQFIKSKMQKKFSPKLDKVAEQFPIVIPMKLANSVDTESMKTKSEKIILPFSPTFAPTTSMERSTENTFIGSGLSTTLRNLFQTERIQKIKMSPTTPVTAPEELMETVLDGIPDGEPGLTSNFYERVPFIPDNVVTPLETTTTTIDEKIDVEKGNIYVGDIEDESVTTKDPLEIQAQENLEEVKMPKVTDEINIKLVIDDMPEAKLIENDIKKALQKSSQREINAKDPKSHMTVHNATPDKTENESVEDVVKEDVKTFSKVEILRENDLNQSKSESKSPDASDEQEMKLNIFNSSDLVLTNFMVNKSQKLEGKKNVKPENIPSNSAAVNTHNDEDFKNRRRKLFRSLSSDSDSGKHSAAKLNNDKLKFRKLFKKKDSNSITDKQITIGEKQNPRKIIFRKNLIRGERRRVPTTTSKDPIVKSLQQQIKKQKSRLRFNRKRPFSKLNELKKDVPIQVKF